VPVPSRRPFRAAARDTVGVGVALVPLGVAFGLLVVDAGLAWWWAPLFSVFIYAGSLEFLAIGLVVALTPLAQIALATVLVNFRHVFYALSFPLHAVRGRAARTYSMYALTDEAYALAHHIPPEERTTARILWMQVFCQSYWVLGGILGAGLGEVLPSIPSGMGFALTALFVVLAIDAHRVTKDVPSPLMALACALVALLVAPGQMLVVAMLLYLGALTVRYRIAVRRRHRSHLDPTGEPHPGTTDPEGDHA
jgi:4-azaleucine resistance transporter AzlC